MGGGADVDAASCWLMASSSFNLSFSKRFVSSITFGSALGNHDARASGAESRLYVTKRCTEEASADDGASSEEEEEEEDAAAPASDEVDALSALAIAASSVAVFPVAGIPSSFARAWSSLYPELFARGIF